MHLTLLLLAHAFAGGLSPKDLEAVRTTHAETEQLVKPGMVDWTAWANAHYEPNAVMLAPGGKPIEGRVAIAKYLASFGTLTHFAVEDLEIDGGGDVAYIRGVYDMSFASVGGTPVRDVGKYIEVWKRQADGSWKCHVEAWNSDAAP